jgi:ankyrin repeat protein
MTFEEASECIKRGDIASLIRSLDSGLRANLSNRLAWTLLMLAALHGNTAIGRELVSRGADIDATNNFGECALSLATQKGHVTFASWLLDAGANKRCRPHGWDLSDWIKQASGLSAEKIATMLRLLRDHRLVH